MQSKNKTYQDHRFPGQKPGEHIQLVIRKHWIIDVRIGVTLFVIGFLPLLLAISTEIFIWDGTLNDTFLTVAIGFNVYFLIILLVTFVKWLNEELDIIIATENRIISHEQIDMFHRQVSEANLGQIQDVTGVQKGFWQSILHYGKLEIQTSSSDVFFVINFVSEPYKNARAILDLRDKTTPNHD